MPVFNQFLNLTSLNSLTLSSSFHLTFTLYILIYSSFSFTVRSHPACKPREGGVAVSCGSATSEVQCI